MRQDKVRRWAFACVVIMVICLMGSGNAFAGTAHRGPVVGGDIAADGSIMVTMSDHPDHTLLFYTPSTGKGLRRVATGQLGQQSAVALSPDGKLAACGTRTYGGDNNELVIVDTAKGAVIHKMRIMVPDMEHMLPGVLDLQFSPDGKKLLVTADENIGVVYDPVSGKMLNHFVTNIGGLTGISAAWLPDNKRVFLGSKNAAAVVDTATGKVLKEFSGFHQAELVDVSADGRFAAVADVAEITILELATGKTVKKFDNKNMITGLVIGAYSPLVACTDQSQKYVSLYNIKTGTRVARVEVPAPYLAFPNMVNLQIAGLSVDNQTRYLVVNAPAMPFIMPIGGKK